MVLTLLGHGRSRTAQKIDGAIRSFAKENVVSPSNEDYLMVLEDSTTGDIVGTCGILATVGLDEPFTAITSVPLPMLQEN